jgi:hypothetical protein
VVTPYFLLLFYFYSIVGHFHPCLIFEGRGVTL